MIFFVDQNDVARIPVELFHKMCEVEAPGCPGPQYKSYVKATKHVFFITLFLLFILGERRGRGEGGVFCVMWCVVIRETTSFIQ